MMTEGDYSMSLNSDMIDFEYLEHFLESLSQKAAPNASFASLWRKESIFKRNIQRPFLNRLDQAIRLKRGIW